MIGHTKLDPAAPAGAIQSSVDEILKWVTMHLNRGEYTGGRIFSAAQSQQMWTPEIFMPIPLTYPKELEALRPNLCRQVSLLGLMAHY